MNVIQCYKYVQDRLNSLSTNSGDNIPKHIFVRTFNAIQDVWVENRYKLNSSNTLRDDELQSILLDVELNPTKDEGFWRVEIPTNYYHFKRAIAYTPCEIFLYKKKEDEVNRLLNDENWKPSLEWQESFCTIMGNTLRVYGDFSIDNIRFLYYRKPNPINMADGFVDELGEPTVDIDPEFQNSSLIEILNQTCMLLASDTSDQFRFQTLGANVTQNT